MYKERKSHNQLQLWQRSVDPWTSKTCEAKMQESVDVISNAKASTNVEDLYIYNEELMDIVQGYEVFSTIITCLILYYACIRLSKGQYLCNFLVVVPIKIASIALETVFFVRLSSHYDTNLAAGLNDAVNGLEGCGGQNFGIAQTELTKSIIYERPLIQQVSLVLNWLMLIAIINYYAAVRNDIELHMQEQRIQMKEQEKMKREAEEKQEAAEQAMKDSNMQQLNNNSALQEAKLVKLEEFMSNEKESWDKKMSLPPIALSPVSNRNNDSLDAHATL